MTARSAAPAARPSLRRRLVALAAAALLSNVAIGLLLAATIGFWGALLRMVF